MENGKRTLLGLCLGMLVVFGGGCSLPADPRTEISYGPFKLHNSKDVGVKIDEAHWNAETGAFDVKGLEFSDTASIVRLANAQQMAAYAEQVKAVADVAKSGIHDLATLGGIIGGGGGGDSTNGMAELLGPILERKIQAAIEARFPALEGAIQKMIDAKFPQPTQIPAGPADEQAPQPLSTVPNQ